MKRIGILLGLLMLQCRYGFRAGQHFKLKYYHEHGDQ